MTDVFPYDLDTMMMARGDNILRYVTNAAALKPAAAALCGAIKSEFYMDEHGDSVTCFGGDVAAVGTPTSEVFAETFGWGARLRTRLNARFGSPDGGVFIPAQARSGDARVANTGCVAVTDFGPMCGYGDTSANNVLRAAMQLKQASDNVTWTVNGRYAKIEIWENAGSGNSDYRGSFSYTIDGGGATTLSTNGGGGATDTYRELTIDLGTDGAHVLSCTWVSGNVLFTGVTITHGSGVVSRRFARGNSTAHEWATKATRVLRTSFYTKPTHLSFLRFSYNDWNTQVAQGFTIAGFKTDIQTLITNALLNTTTKAVVLLNDPLTSTADTNPILYRAFADALVDLANANAKVAHIDLDKMGPTTYALGNAIGRYVDFVHPTALGHDMDAALIEAVLSNPTLLNQ